MTRFALAAAILLAAGCASAEREAVQRDQTDLDLARPEGDVEAMQPSVDLDDPVSEVDEEVEAGRARSASSAQEAGPEAREPTAAPGQAPRAATESPGTQTDPAGTRTERSGTQTSERSAQAEPERKTVRGRIASVDSEENAVVLKPSEGASVRVRVTPLQLADLEAGRDLTAHLVRYGERWWLAEGPTGRPQGPESPQSAIGEVAGVSVDEGRLVLDQDGERRVFQAHPEDIAALKNGQLVSVTYESLKSGDWLREVRGEVEAAEPGDATGTTSTMEMGPAGEEPGGGEPSAQAPRASAEGGGAPRMLPPATDWRKKPTGRSVFSR